MFTLYLTRFIFIFIIFLLQYVLGHYHQKEFVFLDAGESLKEPCPALDYDKLMMMTMMLENHLERPVSLVVKVEPGRDLGFLYSWAGQKSMFRISRK